MTTFIHHELALLCAPTCTNCDSLRSMYCEVCAGTGKDIRYVRATESMLKVAALEARIDERTTSATPIILEDRRQLIFEGSNDGENWVKLGPVAPGTVDTTVFGHKLIRVRVFPPLCAEQSAP